MNKIKRERRYVRKNVSQPRGNKNYGDERKEEHREAGMEVDCERKSGAAVG